MSKLCILLPVYNAKLVYFKSSLTSVIVEDGIDKEILVGLDGPCDEGILDIIEKKKKEVSCSGSSVTIRIIEMEHRGITETLNTLIDMSDCKWLARQDADDISLPTRFSRQVKALEENRAHDFCGTQVLRANKDLVPRRVQRGYPKTFECQLAYASCLNNPIAHPTLMVRRSALAATRYQSCTNAEDWKLYIELWLRGLKSFNLPSRELIYRTHACQVTNNARDWRLVKKLKMESLVAAKGHGMTKGIMFLHYASNILHASELGNYVREFL